MLAYVASVTSRDIEASDSIFIVVVLIRPPSETDEASGGIKVVLIRLPFETDEASGGIEVVLIRPPFETDEASGFGYIEVVLITPPSSVFDELVQIVSEND